MFPGDDHCVRHGQLPAHLWQGARQHAAQHPNVHPQRRFGIFVFVCAGSGHHRRGAGHLLRYDPLRADRLLRLHARQDAIALLPPTLPPFHGAGNRGLRHAELSEQHRGPRDFHRDEHAAGAPGRRIGGFDLWHSDVCGGVHPALALWHVRFPAARGGLQLGRGPARSSEGHRTLLLRFQRDSFAAVSGGNRPFARADYRVVHGRDGPYLPHRGGFRIEALQPHLHHTLVFVRRAELYAGRGKARKRFHHFRQHGAGVPALAAGRALSAGADGHLAEFCAHRRAGRDSGHHRDGALFPQAARGHTAARRARSRCERDGLSNQRAGRKSKSARPFFIPEFPDAARRPRQRRRPRYRQPRRCPPRSWRRS